MDAQVGGDITHYSTILDGAYHYQYVVTANGDLFSQRIYESAYPIPFSEPAYYHGNFLAGDVGTTMSTWGDIKQQR